MKYFLLLTVVIFVCSCSEKIEVDENIYSRYIDSDLNYFFENSIDDDLFIGLKSIVVGDYSKAEKVINQIIPYVSDSLKMNLYIDLAEISYWQKNWEKGNKYSTLSDSSLDKNSNPYIPFSNYPKESFTILNDTVTVNYDGFYIQGKINNRDESENIILDTGFSPSAISFSLAKKYNLKIDSTGFESTASGFAIKTGYNPTVIKHLKLNDVEFQNIPVFVISDDLFTKMGLKGQFILGLPEISVFDCVEFDYPENKFRMIKKVEKSEKIIPNLAILGSHIMIDYSVNSVRITGVIDTGSPSADIFTSDKWNPKKFTPVRTEKKTWGQYSYTVNYFRFPVSFSNCLNNDFEFLIHKDRIPSHRFKIESLLGKNIWSDKKMVIDFRNRNICFH